MRSLLAVLVLLGAGVSFAQTPTTYSPGGAGVVTSIEGMTNAQADYIVQGIDGNTFQYTFDRAVTWDYDDGGNQTTYTGQLTFDRVAMAGHVDTFYGATCQTTDQTDCGRWGTGNTGTSLDTYMEDKPNPISAWGTFSHTGTSGSLPSEPSVVENFCGTVGGSVDKMWSIMNWTRTYTDGTPDEQWYVLYQSTGSVEDWQTSSSVGLTGLVDSAESSMGSSCVTDWPTLAKYIDGNYFAWNAQSEYNTDAREGIRIALAEGQAELDRLRIEAADDSLSLLSGLTIDPVPSPLEAQADDGAPWGEGGGGGGGDGGDVDPGDCTDGWFLTNLVCIIRDQGERLWDFLSEDAWVPSTSFQNRVDTLGNAYEEVIPFALFNSTGTSSDRLAVGTQPWDESTLAGDNCPSWSLHVAGLFEPIKNVAGFSVINSADQVTVDFCDNEYVDWMAGAGRDVLLYAAGVAMSIWFIVTVVGASRGN